VSCVEAERAYVLAYAMGALRTLPRRGSTALGPAPATPTPQEVMAAFASLSDDFLGAEWETARLVPDLVRHSFHPAGTRTQSIS
jgi:hypothetical protein